MKIDEINFNTEVMSCELPVVVTFWAEWCGACHIIAPAMEELASEYNGKLKIGILDVDRNKSIVEKYGIKSYPTMLFFKKNNLKDRVSGVISKKELKEKVMTLL